MSKTWQLNALLRKNLILMKRSCCLTVCEILFPIILMILLVLVRRAFAVTEYKYTFEDDVYFSTNSSILISPDDLPVNSNSPVTNLTGLVARNPLRICSSRPTIALIGSGIPQGIVSGINKVNSYYGNANLTYFNYTSVEALNRYITSESYGTSSTNPQICFGIFFNKIDDSNFNVSLHYFDSIIRGAIRNIPSGLVPSLDPFQNGPDMENYKLWLNSGYLQMMQILNEEILRTVTNNPNASINMGVMNQKYSVYKQDAFGNFIGFILPFFIIIAYVSPLCVLVFRMVKERETRAKEGMKIMGLGEGVYFLSYFIQWLVLNSIYAVINSAILTRVLQNTGYLFILGFFWLFGMNIFALAFFFQAIMDRTRIAMIVTILVYFIMFFVSVAVLSEDVLNIGKMLLSLLPPTSLQLGLSVLAKFEGNGKRFDGSSVTYKYNNYSVSDMYLMFFIDFFVYLILGYYFQNILTHQFGIKKPFYFLCTKSFWCKTKKKHSQSPMQVEMETVNFQSEKNYNERITNGDYLRINNLRKTFDDGKVAVDGLNLNLYKNEIFALLGHNGAGKSTTISILCGLYEATSGEAYYNDENVLTSESMINFRKKLGICPQHNVLFDNLTVKEHLRMFCVFKGVENSKIEQEVESIIKDFGMTDKSDTLSKNLSGGQKRKLSVAIALVGGSEIVFLDEPTSGMDITSRRNLWEILKGCIGNRIIVLTTHYMEEAAVLGNRIGIMSGGKLKCCGSGLFLTERFGKYITMNVLKNQDASDDEIIEFVKSREPEVETEVLTEEIIFRIPKLRDNDMKSVISLKNFFNDIDDNLQRLKIKSYGASMPTLEDVFLNVSAETHDKFDKKLNNSQIAEENDKLIFENNSPKIETSSRSKIFTDLRSSLKKRFIQIIRDKKSFFLEVLCPILLVLIGLGVSSVEFNKNSPSILLSPQLIGKQSILVNSRQFDGSPVPTGLSFNQLPEISIITKDMSTNQTDLYSAYKDYLNVIYNSNLTNSYAGYYFSKIDDTNKNYEVTTFVNTQARNSPIIYTQDVASRIISYAAGRPINISFRNSPMPLLDRWRKQGQTRNSSNLVFFVSIAFALIPANFVTLIIKEREFNTKHLQIISGISLTSYWISNFIFELTKYFFTGGICLLLIYAWDTFPPYLWLIYIIYGFSMVSFTYLFSFVFTSESTAQNMVILVNCLFGALGGTIILVLRTLEDIVQIAKGIAFILRVIPSFSFAYGFNQLLSGQLLFYIDYPLTFLSMNVEKDILRLEYVGADCLYMGVEVFLFVIAIILWENFSGRCSCCIGRVHRKQQLEHKDSDVRNEMEKASRLGDSKFSIQVRNLQKAYSTQSCGCKSTVAVNNLSFCLDYGECFALLGVNGAGKTTTFKCLTREILPTSGEIFINGMDISRDFSSVRSLIGYCPQFDAIFEYMTVYENLEFYARIKGISSDRVQGVVEALMKEMNLTQYRNKESGNLSGGNKRKLSVCIAMIGNPPIVLLDEPSAGMDPEARRFMWAVIHKISTKRKLSSVILTTHSMEEAETLCRRMGIMVGGQFKCLGSSQRIKDKYGFGFEIDIRIGPMPTELLEKVLTESRLDARLEVDASNIQQVFTAINKTNYANMTEQLGYDIHKSIKADRKVSLQKIVEWTFYVENALRCISRVSAFFNDISIIESVESNFKFKIKKTNSVNEKSIGFLFGLLEDIKNELHVTEYSIQQTSLEQIFNSFAIESDEAALVKSAKKEIQITKDILEYLYI